MWRWIRPIRRCVAAPGAPALAGSGLRVSSGQASLLLARSSAGIAQATSCAEGERLSEQLSQVAAELHSLQEALGKASPELRQKLACASIRSACETDARLTRLDEPTEIENFVAQLGNEEVRALSIATMSRHFGQDFRTEFAAIDVDGSGTVDRAEFKRYLSRLSSTLQSEDATRPSNRQLALFALNSAIPFVVFGFLDNSIMLVGSEAVENCLGSALHLSQLACAALANTCADVLGISIGNSVEALTVRLGLPSAELTAAQSGLPLVRRLGIVSSSAGILVGCLMGMFPLLFMDPEKKELKEAFKRVDVNDTGALAPRDLKKVFAVMGFHDLDDKTLERALREVGLGSNERITQKEFLDHASKLRDLVKALTE